MRRVSLKWPKFVGRRGQIKKQSLDFKRIGQLIESRRVPLKRKLSLLTEFIRSPNSPLVSPFYTGWEHESLGFVTDWFFRKISRKKHGKIQYASLGVGNGVKVLINKKIIQLFGFRDVDILGIDINRKALNHAAQLNPEGIFQRTRLPARENYLRKYSGKFHIVESSNLLHEVFSQAGKHGSGWVDVDSVLSQARRLIGSEGGIFLVHDGVLPERSERLVNVRLSPRYARALRVFSRILPQKSVKWVFQERKERSGEAVLSVGNLSRFLSKARYLTEPDWRSQYPPKRELRQVYPFASMQEMSSHLLKAGFDAVIAMDYSDRAIREKWAKNCLVQGAELPHNYGRFFAFVLPEGIDRKKALKEIRSLETSLLNSQLPSLADEKIGRIRVFTRQG